MDRYMAAPIQCIKVYVKASGKQETPRVGNQTRWPLPACCATKLETVYILKIFNVTPDSQTQMHANQSAGNKWRETGAGFTTLELCIQNNTVL